MSITLCADLEVTVLFNKGEKAMELSNVCIELNVKGIYCVSKYFFTPRSSISKDLLGFAKIWKSNLTSYPEKKPHICEISQLPNKPSTIRIYPIRAEELDEKASTNCNYAHLHRS